LLLLCSSTAIATTKAALFIALTEVLPKPRVFEHTKSEANTQGLSINDRKRRLSVGYATLARIAISIRGHPRTDE
jgi:hypothetical protein